MAKVGRDLTVTEKYANLAGHADRVSRVYPSPKSSREREASRRVRIAPQRGTTPTVSLHKWLNNLVDVLDNSTARASLR
jgi:hypothetical protein